MNPDKPTIVYYLDFGNFKKIGITQQTVKKRIAKFPPCVVLDTYECPLDEALDIEREIKLRYPKIDLDNPVFERQGKTECFISDADSIIDLLGT